MAFPKSPRLFKGAIILKDANTGVLQRIISLQYNPGTLTRTLQMQGGDGGGDRAEALRLTGPPQETYKLEAEIDATDQLEFPEQNINVTQYGILPQLAALETIVYPDSSQLVSNNNLAASGTLEIVPMESPLTLFRWGCRILPVRITEFSITEEAFDRKLNPIRAKISLGMRVLNINDLGFNHLGGNLFMIYHRKLEYLANLSQEGGATG